MATLFRYYSIIPILWICWISNEAGSKAVDGSLIFVNLCSTRLLRDTSSENPILRQIGYFCTSLGVICVGPIFYPIEQFYWWESTFSEEEKKKHDMERKKYWFFDSASSFVCHSTVLIIIIILWETTSALDQNLSICTYPLIKNNISIICAIIMTLSVLNCLIIDRL